MASLLQSSSIAELAAQALAQLNATPAQARPADATASESADEHPLSYGQRALWFLHQLAPESAAYNLSFAARVRSALDVDALRRPCRRSGSSPLFADDLEAKGRPRRASRRAELSSARDAALWGETECGADGESPTPVRTSNGGRCSESSCSAPGARHLVRIKHHVVADSGSSAWAPSGLVYEWAGGTPAPLAPLRSARRTTPAGAAAWRGRKARGCGPTGTATRRGTPLRIFHDGSAPIQGLKRCFAHVALDGELSRALKKPASPTTRPSTRLLAAFKRCSRYTGHRNLVGSPRPAERSELGDSSVLRQPMVMRVTRRATHFAELLRQVRQTSRRVRASGYPFPRR